MNNTPTQILQLSNCQIRSRVLVIFLRLTPVFLKVGEVEEPNLAPLPKTNPCLPTALPQSATPANSTHKNRQNRLKYITGRPQRRRLKTRRQSQNRRLMTCLGLRHLKAIVRNKLNYQLGSPQEWPKYSDRRAIRR